MLRHAALLVVIITTAPTPGVTHHRCPSTPSVHGPIIAHIARDCWTIRHPKRWKGTFVNPGGPIIRPNG